MTNALEISFTKLNYEQIARLAKVHKGTITSPIFVGPQAVWIEFETVEQARICMRYVHKFPHIFGENISVELRSL